MANLTPKRGQSETASNLTGHRVYPPVHLQRPDSGAGLTGAKYHSAIAAVR
jgi:hypothetical protein